MKNNLLLLLGIFLLLVSCKSNIESDSYWLAVKSYPSTEKQFHYNYDGIIIHFLDDKIEIGDVFSDNFEDFNLSIINKKITANDTLLSNIYAIYEDSLLLDINENTRVKFIRLDNKHSLNKELEFWNHKNWILSTNEHKRELILTDLVYADESESKLCIQKDLQENRFISTIDKWNVVKINGNQLFVKTMYQSDIEFYRINKYVGDSIIKLESIGYPYVMKVELKKQLYISNSKKIEILNKIQNHKWFTDKIIIMDSVSRGTIGRNSKLLKLESLNNKKTSFIFSSDLTYDIYESETLVESGNWKLSQTGNEIVLNFGLNPSDYIDLINVFSDSLEVANLRWFEPKKQNYGMNVEMYYKIKLTK